MPVMGPCPLSHSARVGTCWTVLSGWLHISVKSAPSPLLHCGCRKICDTCRTRQWALTQVLRQATGEVGADPPNSEACPLPERSCFFFLGFNIIFAIFKPYVSYTMNIWLPENLHWHCDASCVAKQLPWCTVDASSLWRRDTREITFDTE